MTTERINHRAHDHGNTKADRASCRRRMRRYHAELVASIIRVGDTVLAKLDDAPEREAVVLEILPWGSGLRYMCRFPSGWVYGTCRVRKV